MVAQNYEGGERKGARPTEHEGHWVSRCGSTRDLRSLGEGPLPALGRDTLPTVDHHVNESGRILQAETLQCHCLQGRQDSGGDVSLSEAHRSLRFDAVFRLELKSWGSAVFWNSRSSREQLKFTSHGIRLRSVIRER
jgi:hypothetical protein